METKINRSKKAEMTITQTLTTILLIIGFTILLFIFYRVYQSVNIDTETCHQSVIFRATAGYISPAISSGLAKSYAPLKCRTAKICITSGLFGGKCEEFTGEKGITTVKVSNLNDLQKTYAQEILNCWSMMGEGKIDLFSGYTVNTLGLGKISPSCVICSRVAWDIPGLTKAGINLSQVDIEKYMATHYVPNKNQTYLSYIGGERGKISVNNNFAIPNENTTANPNPGTTTLLPSADVVQLEKNANQLTKSDAIIFMQISAPGHLDSALSIGKVLFGGTVGSFAIAPVTTTRSLYSLGSACATPVGSLVCAGVLAIVGVAQQGMVAYNRGLAAGYCGDISVGEEARNGCSVVRTMIYNATSISQYCSNIEGLP